MQYYFRTLLLVLFLYVPAVTPRLLLSIIFLSPISHSHPLDFNAHVNNANNNNDIAVASSSSSNAVINNDSSLTLLRGSMNDFQHEKRHLKDNNNRNDNHNDNNKHSYSLFLEDFPLHNLDTNQRSTYHNTNNHNNIFATSNQKNNNDNFGTSVVDITSSLSSNIKALVILLRWKDHEDRDVVPKENIETFFTGIQTEENMGIIPTGSIHDYIHTMSYSTVSLQATVIDWQTTDNTEAYYAQVSQQGLTRQITAAFRPLLDQMDLDGFNWQEFDQDNDGILDLVVFMHSGYDAIRGGIDCQSGALQQDRIATNANVAVNNWISSNGFQLGNYVMATSLRQVCGTRITRIGTIVRVLFHSFGLPYLFDTAGPLNVGAAVGGLGNYDVMSNPAGQANLQTHPGHLSAWSKITMGFITPTEIKFNDVYNITPQEISPVAYKISIGFTPGEYLLIEYRKPIEGDYDQYMYGNGGILIYRINENEIDYSTGNQGRGYPTQQQQEQTDLPWPENGNNYPISLLQADGLYELEQAINGGNEQDFYKTPDQILQPYSNVLNNYPNTDGYGNNNSNEIISTGISIFNFQQISDNEYSFEVSGMADKNDNENNTPMPATTTTTTIAPSAIPTSIPTIAPSISNNPSAQPTSKSTMVPSNAPSTQPTRELTSAPTATISSTPSTSPTSSTLMPTTSYPTTSFPSSLPSIPFSPKKKVTTNENKNDGKNGPTKATTILVIVLANIIVLVILLTPKLLSLKNK